MRLFVAFLAVMALLTGPVAMAATLTGCGAVDGFDRAGAGSASAPCAMQGMASMRTSPVHPPERQHTPASALCAQACGLVATVPAPAVGGVSAAPAAGDAIDHASPRPLARPARLAAGVDHPPKLLA